MPLLMNRTRSTLHFKPLLTMVAALGALGMAASCGARSGLPAPEVEQGVDRCRHPVSGGLGLRVAVVNKAGIGRKRFLRAGAKIRKRPGACRNECQGLQQARRPRADGC